MVRLFRMVDTMTLSNIGTIIQDTKLEHIAIIMDGNRRWAKEKNLPGAFGHKKGVEALKTTLRACNDLVLSTLQFMLFLRKIGIESRKKLIF